MTRQFYGKNVEITEPLKDYINEKLDHLEKVNNELVACRVDLSRDTHHNKGDVFRAEFNLTIPSNLLRVVELRPDAREAIDLATDKLLRQLRDLKNKKLWRRRFGRLFKRG